MSNFWVVYGFHLYSFTTVVSISNLFGLQFLSHHGSHCIFIPSDTDALGLSSQPSRYHFPYMCNSRICAILVYVHLLFAGCYSGWNKKGGFKWNMFLAAPSLDSDVTVVSLLRWDVKTKDLKKSKNHSKWIETLPNTEYFSLLVNLTNNLITIL